MHRSVSIVTWRFAAVLCTCVLGGFASAQTSVRSVTVLGTKDAVEIEVDASDRIVPETRVLTGPDRLVVDFPNSIPGAQLRSQSVDRGEVKNVRVGLFQAKPPITRLVLDLKSAQSFQIFPYGRTVMIKVSGGETAVQTVANAPSAPLIPANATVVPAQPAPPPQPELIVSYRDGLLGIRANKATLSEVLTAIQHRTGADVSMAAGAEEEMVAVNIEPAPASEVLARLLNGSRFNFLILNSADDSKKLDKVILTLRPEGSVAPLPMLENNSVVPEVAPPLEPQNEAPAPVQPPPPAGPSNPQPEPPPPNGPNQ